MKRIQPRPARKAELYTSPIIPLASAKGTKPRRKPKLRLARPPAPQPQDKPPPDPFTSVPALIIGAMLAGPAAREDFYARLPEYAVAKGLQELAGIFAGSLTSNDGIINYLSHATRKQVIDELRGNNYLTNDMIEITGGFARYDHREIRVNGVIVLVDRREYMLASLLAHHGHQHELQSGQLRNDATSFMPVNKILDAIDVLKARHSKLGDLWTDATYHTIHQVISDLRRKLEAAGLHKHLIESRANGAGYRWSTRPGNIDNSGLGDDPPAPLVPA